MQNKLLLFIFLAVPMWMGFSPGDTKVDFFTGSLTAVKDRAATEGKLYFIDFTASWCMPCRWMDETTFTDPTLANYVKNNYIAVKVDIDDFDGYAYKQVHNVKMLPSILIFNSKGKEIDRYEESLSAGRFLEILKKHNTAANRVKTRTSAPPPPPPPPPVKPPPTASTGSSSSSSDHTGTYSGGSADTQPATDPIGSGEGLYRFKVTRQPSSGYSVQIGAFAEYGNVLTEAERLDKMFSQPIIVHIAKLRGKTVYKVLIGEFRTLNQASRFKAKVRQKGIEAIVKDLSTMQ